MVGIIRLFVPATEEVEPEQPKRKNHTTATDAPNGLSKNKVLPPAFPRPEAANRGKR